MIYWTLFYEFFKIGLFTIGGGYAMIPLIQQVTVGNGWITTNALLNMIAISESTPGPFAINMATFVGYNQAGFLGALCTNLGVALPSFLIILLIAKLISHVNMKNKYIQGMMGGMSPIVVGLISVAFINTLLQTSFGYVDYTVPIESVDVVSLIIVAIMGLLLTLRKKTNVIVIIIGSGLLGMLGYYIESII